MNLGSLLKLAGLSREGVAALVGVSIDSVHSWCSRRSPMGLRHLSRMVQVLEEAGVSQALLRDLLTDGLVRKGMDTGLSHLLAEREQPAKDRPVILMGSHLNAGSYQFIALGVHDALQARGVDSALYLDTCARRDVLKYYLTAIAESPAQGVVIVMPRQVGQELLVATRRLASRRVPCVFVYVGWAPVPNGCPAVQVDSYSAAVMATQFLWARGHRDIAAIALDPFLGQAASAQGYSDAMERLGRRSRLIWAMATDDGPRPSASADRPALREVAEQVAVDPCVTAILALTAQTAKEVMRALHSRGRTPGKDVSVMGLGCWDWMHDVAFPPITHLALPYYTAGQRAANLLLDLSTREPLSEERHIVVSPSAEQLHAGEAGTVATRL